MAPPRSEPVMRPIDCGRVWRVLLAKLEDDHDKAEAVLEEAVRAGELPELTSAMVAFLLEYMRYANQDNLDAMKQNAYSLIAQAQLEDGWHLSGTLFWRSCATRALARTPNF